MNKIKKEMIYIFMNTYLSIYILFLFICFSMADKENIKFYGIHLLPIIILLSYFSYKDYKNREETKIQVQSLFINSYKKFFLIILLEMIFLFMFAFLLSYYLNIMKYEEEHYKQMRSIKSSFIYILIFCLYAIYFFKVTEVFYKFCHPSKMKDLNKYINNRLIMFDISKEDLKIYINSYQISDRSYMDYYLRSLDIKKYERSDLVESIILIKYRNVSFKISSPIENRNSNQRNSFLIILIDDKEYEEFKLIEYLRENKISFNNFIKSKEDHQIYEMLQY